MIWVGDWVIVIERVVDVFEVEVVKELVKIVVEL